MAGAVRGKLGMHMWFSWWQGEVVGSAYVLLNRVPRDAAAASACAIACLKAGVSAKVSPRGRLSRLAY